MHFDTWFSERSLVADGAIAATLADLAARHATYEADGAVWLRSTDFGDDKDRVLVKSDGEPTYLLPDIAYHRNKFERGYEQLIDIWGADHHGYVARLKAGSRPSATTPPRSSSSSASWSRSSGAAKRSSCRSGPAPSVTSARSSRRPASTPPASRSCSSRSTPARRSTSPSWPPRRWRTR
ncbi:MAG: hypothetical protein R2755_33375 [Acidimicrobiales bacterium]